MMRHNLLVTLLVGALGLALVQAASQATDITVDIGTEQVPLTVEAGVDFVDAAAAFCDHYGVDKSLNVARLVAALEKESARQNVQAVAASKQLEPLVSLPLVVREQQTALSVYPGDDPVQVVRQFGAQHQLNDAELNYVFQALQQELRSLASQARIMATVDVDVETANGQIRTVPMYLREGQTPEGAATQFATTHELPARTVPTLVAAIQRQIAPRPVFTVPLVVDGTPRELTLYENQAPIDAATSFCSGFGIEAEECKKVRAAVLRRIQQANAEAAQAQAQAQAQAEAQARAQAQAQAQAQATPRGVVSVVVGDNTFDVEYEQGVTAAVLARHFCRQQLGAVQQVLAQQGTARVTEDDCVAVLVNELSRRAA